MLKVDVTSSDDAALHAALLATTLRIQELHSELGAAFPSLRGNLAISDTFMGHGLAALVSNGMTDDQIVAHVLGIVAEVREARQQLTGDAS